MTGGEELRRNIDHLPVIVRSRHAVDTHFYLDTDICVISNALMLRSIFPQIKITVIADACVGTTYRKHNAALDVMESCLINVKTSNMI